MRTPRALLVMSPGLDRLLFTASQRERLEGLLDVAGCVPDAGALTDPALADIEVLVTGWGAGQVSDELLDRLPRLRAIIHTAGTVHALLGPGVLARQDILVTTAARANAVPVAEYTLAQIILANKRAPEQVRAHRERRGRGGVWRADGDLGNYGAVVGIIGASRIGRLVAQLLQPFDLEVLLADPFADETLARELGARLVELPELFAGSDVVSLHAPDVPSTRHLVGAPLLALMRDGATFINTARPALVDEDALRKELVAGRIDAVLDVHDHLGPQDPLWDCPNVEISPHIAGSQGNELHRLAEAALEEVARFVAGEPPIDPVDRARFHVTA